MLAEKFESLLQLTSPLWAELICENSNTAPMPSHCSHQVTNVEKLVDIDTLCSILITKGLPQIGPWFENFQTNSHTWSFLIRCSTTALFSYQGVVMTPWSDQPTVTHYDSTWCIYMNITARIIQLTYLRYRFYVMPPKTRKMYHLCPGGWPEIWCPSCKHLSKEHLKTIRRILELRRDSKVKHSLSTWWLYICSTLTTWTGKVACIRLNSMNLTVIAVC